MHFIAPVASVKCMAVLKVEFPGSTAECYLEMLEIFSHCKNYAM